MVRIDRLRNNLLVTPFPDTGNGVQEYPKLLCWFAHQQKMDTVQYTVVDA